MVRNLDIGALRSLVAIADTDSVTKAAAQINLSQSAVSMQIKRLEETFDAKLLHREGRGVALTAVGEHLVSYARRMLVINDETWTRLTNDDYQGDVVFGVPVDVVYPNVPYILKRATTLYPRIRLSLVSSLTKLLRQRLKDGDIDLILTTEDRLNKGGETLQHVEHHWCGAVNGKAHLTRPLPLSICHQCSQKQDVIKTLDAANVPWKLIGDTDSEITVDAIVSADLAVTPKIHTPGNCTTLPAGVLPPLDDVLINMYQAPHRDSALIEKIADVVRDAFRRSLRMAAAG